MTYRAKTKNTLGYVPEAMASELYTARKQIKSGFDMAKQGPANPLKRFFYNMELKRITKRRAR